LLNALKTLLLLGVCLRGFLLDGTHIDGTKMLRGIEILV
jgi:hypothetical protein